MEKMTFKQKIEHFWFYYKWHTLIILFFVMVFAILITQMAEREDHDIKVLYAGPAIITDAESAEICAALEQLMPTDYDGDGTKRVALNDLIIMNEDQLAAVYDQGYSAYTLNMGKINENKELLTSNAYAGDFLIFMLSEECYAPLSKAGAFVKLEDYGITTGMRRDDYAVYLDSLDIAKFVPALKALPEDTVLCVRRVMTTEDGESDQELSQKQHMELLKIMTEFKLPEGFEAGK